MPALCRNRQFASSASSDKTTQSYLKFISHRYQIFHVLLVKNFITHNSYKLSELPRILDNRCGKFKLQSTDVYDHEHIV